jgi:hypothetical protein
VFLQDPEHDDHYAYGDQQGRKGGGLVRNPEQGIGKSSEQDHRETIGIMVPEIDGTLQQSCCQLGIMYIIISKMTGVSEKMIKDYDDDEYQEYGICARQPKVHASKLSFQMKIMYSDESTLYLAFH